MLKTAVDTNINLKVANVYKPLWKNGRRNRKLHKEQYAGHSQQLIGIIPQISFNEFFDKVKNDKYDGENELKEIRSKFSKEILDNDKKCGVAIW